MLIALDSGPLGDIVNPNNSAETRAIRSWMKSHLLRGVGFLLPEIADYEVRRNLVLEVLIAPSIGPCRSEAALYLLDQLKTQITYIPLTTPMMKLAADLWAEQRKGKTTHSPKLDGDAILTAQAIETSAGIERIVIATDNVRDFMFIPSIKVTAEEWDKII